MRRVLLTSLVAVTPFALVAQVATVEITPGRVTARAGDSLQLALTVTDSAGRVVPGASALWMVGPFEVAAVDQNGTVRTFRQGTARVLARVGNKVGSAELVILPKRPANVVMSSGSSDVLAGGVTLVRGVAATEDGEPRHDVSVSFRSSDPRIATVDAGGVVRGVAPGTAVITGQADGARGEISIRVLPNPVAAVAVTGPRMARTGDVVRFRAEATARDGRSAGEVPVLWSVSGGGGARVDPDGGFVAEESGTYVVTAVAGTVASAASIVVRQREHDVTFETVGSVVFSELQAAEHWAINDVLYVSTIADRVYTFDIRDPASPRLVDSVMVDARIVNDVSTNADGTIGVITRQGASSRKNGIVFLDLADPLRPKILSEYTATVTSGVHSAYVDGHYVDLTDDGSRGMIVVDFRDPKHPREVSRWSVENSHLAVDQSTGTTVGRYLHDLQVKDGLAYLAYFKDGAIILDVGNGIRGGSPDKPQFVSRYTYSTTDYYPPDMLAGTHTVFRFRDYLVVGDEVFPQFFDSDARDRIRTLGRLHILDVSDILNPRKVAEYHVPENGSHNVWVENDVMYVGNFEAGVRVVDMSGELRGNLRRQGREIGSIWAASPDGFRPNIPMTWGATPHRGVVYATDMNSGLWVGRLTPKRPVP